MTERTLEDADLTAEGKEKLRIADALDELAERLRGADSISSDVPELSKLYHEVRTSGRNSRDGRFVALLDHDEDGWTCRSIAFLETGTHYRDPNADALVSFSPFPFLSVDEFGEHVASDLERDARAARQNAWAYQKEPNGPRGGA